MPMEKSRYPKEWPEIARRIKANAGWKCQKCGKQCRKPGEKLDTHQRTLPSTTLTTARKTVHLKT